MTSMCVSVDMSRDRSNFAMKYKIKEWVRYNLEICVLFYAPYDYLMIFINVYESKYDSESVIYDADNRPFLVFKGPVFQTSWRILEVMKSLQTEGHYV